LRLPSTLMGVVAGELTGRVLGGRFRLEALVGRGASGEVYLAVDTRLRRRVAVKVLHQAVGSDPQFLRRFRSEAQLASRLTHPNILIIHDWDDGEPAHLITEFLDGGSLRSMLDRHHRLSLSQVVLVGIEAARALAHAHSHGIVHRDIKPANLLFAADGSLRIGDFGLARALAEAAHTEPEGAMVGTARYSSPEQLLGAALDGRADVYSLLLVLIEAATGETPFRADTPLGVLMARQRQAVEIPESMGVLAEALSSAGSVDPEDRCDAATLVRRLERVTKHLPRPEPLPLVITVDVRSSSLADPTVHHATDVIDLTLVPSISLPPTSPLPPQTLKPAAFDLPRQTVVAIETQGVHDQQENDGSDFVASPSSSPSSSRPSSRPSRRPSRRRGAKLAVSALLLAGFGAGAFFSWSWWTSRPQWSTVPSVVRLETTEAQRMIDDASLIVSTIETFNEVVPKGVVISQLPMTGIRVEEGTEVDLTVSKGPAPRPVPRVIGMTVEAAGSTLQGLGLVLTSSEVANEDVAKGLIIGAEPATGSLAKGGVVKVIVSSGPAPRIVPNLSGMTVEQAKEALPAGLNGVVVEQSSETVAKGVVIAANYKPDSKLDRGSTVKILVSTGPAPVEVPATKGLEVVAATKKLKEAGFVVSATQGSPDQPVTGTKPAAGAFVRRGSSLVIITGP
jgi:eukaryotic-like serine/threonine-protein kinase